jgi:low temperature requirement protein LtrA
MREPSPWTSTPSRGAPFAGYMLVGLLAGLLIASQTPYVPFALVVVVAYLGVGSRWNHALWESRWVDVEDRGTVPENAAFWTTAVLLIIAAVAAPQGNDVLPWVTLATQVAIAAVIIPVTLRRYPGVLPG